MSVAVARLFLCKLSKVGFFCKCNLIAKSLELLGLDVLRFIVFSDSFSVIVLVSCTAR